jgi:hypothetical protein
MIAFVEAAAQSTASWQESFLAMLPEIESRLRREFRDLPADSREEAVREGVAHCLFAFVRLHERGGAHRATPFTLVYYSSRHVRRGRPAAGRMNSNDPLSRYAQLGRGIRVEPQGTEWIAALVEDKRAPVPEQVAARMDVGAWFATLSKRSKEIAKDLAVGCSTSEVAEKHGLTLGRISQLRRVFEESWAAFQEAAPATAGC